MLEQSSARRCDLVAQALEALLVGLEARDVALELVRSRDQPGGVGRVLALETLELREARFDRFQSARIGFYALGEAAQRESGLLQVRERCGQRFARWNERRDAIAPGAHDLLRRLQARQQR